jgi:hypothetical protein
MSWILRNLIAVYQYFVSPHVGVCCRFEPTCSHYASEAIHKYGVIKGLILMTSRILKCHPFHPGGLDPVP